LQRRRVWSKATDATGQSIKQQEKATRTGTAAHSYGKAFLGLFTRTNSSELEPADGVETILFLLHFLEASVSVID
jgi:hypothetical protein